MAKKITWGNGQPGEEVCLWEGGNYDNETVRKSSQLKLQSEFFKNTVKELIFRKAGSPVTSAVK